MTLQHQSDNSGPTFTLALSAIDNFFNAPDADPFGAGDSEVLGQAGIVYVHDRIKRIWPRTPRLDKLVIQLPQSAVPDEPSARDQLQTQVQDALQRYCVEKESATNAERALNGSIARRQTVISALFIVLALVLMIAVLYGRLDSLSPFVRGVLAIVPLFVASLAIWDALDALFFQWVPAAVATRAYRALGKSSVLIVPQVDG